MLQREPEQGAPVLAVLEKPNAFHSLLKPERPQQKSLEPAPIDDEEEGIEDEPEIEVTEHVENKAEKQDLKA